MMRVDISDAEAVASLVGAVRPAQIVHLAAQAGVRDSLENPVAYQKSNLAGHLAVLEASRRVGVKSLVYASSNSVYGERPLRGRSFSETDATDAPE